MLDLLAATSRSVLVTIKRDGRPQLSNVTHHYDPVRRLVRVSVTADRAKARNLERDPRASLHVSSEDFWSWTVVEGEASLSAVAADPHDEAVDELVDLYRALAGEHPDWEDYRAAMVRDRRRVVRLPVARAYGQPPR
ncbi:TIGR03618 family F420-dependent PPOX class oxidoreductase [Kineococcus sp. T13]|nr:PPOX class F420-dependent oxidoreductase [Kineococcus vitellinus]NAZ77437.1 TIGR03618 family F420-dependent PPOX class oxidoreductase [Kineococcus vitellinus]